MIAFALPWAFALLPAPLVVWRLAPPAPQRGAVLAPESVVAHLSRHGDAREGRRAGVADLALKAICWLAVVTALAGPYLRQPDLMTPTGRDIVVAVDLSASMAEEDMTVAGRRIARIDVIRDRLAAFLASRRGDRAALIGFAEEAFLIAPFSFDVKAVAEMLGEAPIGLPGRKTDLGRAIGLAVKTLREEPEGERLIILISDGEANAGDLAATDAAAMADGIGAKIVAIGFAADLEGGEAAHMSDLAAATGGAFVAAGDAGALDEAVAALTAMAPTARPDAATERRRDAAWAPLLLAILSIGVLMWREARDP